MTLVQRRITTAAEMRALAHPVRLELVDLLGAEGALTASEAARRLGETPANVSWHLRKLGEHGFVRQGVGRGRNRPWKLVAEALAFGDDAEDATAAAALSDLFFDREFQIFRASMRGQGSETSAWREATLVTQARLWLTPAEVETVGRRIQEVFRADGYVERNADPAARPPGARLMALMGWVVPYGAAPAEAAGPGRPGAPEASGASPAAGDVAVPAAEVAEQRAAGDR